MIEDIQIEQHSFANDGDEEDLYEITHLTRNELEELNSHISLSAELASERIRRLQRKLKKFLFVIDSPIAS